MPTRLWVVAERRQGSAIICHRKADYRMMTVPEIGHFSAISPGSAMGEFAYMALHNHNQVMTEEQMETLRAQICWYSAICSQLVEMHKAMSQQQPLQPSLITGQCMLYDPAAVSPGLKMSARQRWTPTQAQLQILETLFEKGNSSPNKLKVKEITIELSQHGQISETNVYNWFQNRKARAKKKQILLSQKELESEIETDDESSRKKRAKAESITNPENMCPKLTEATTQTLQRNHGAVQHKLPTGEQEQFEFEEKELASLLLSESCDEAKHHISFDTTRQAEVVNAGDSFTRSLSEVKPIHLLNTVGSAECGMNQTKFPFAPIEASRTMTVLHDRKPWKMLNSVVDLRSIIGDDAVLQDFHGHTIPTNNIGVAPHLLIQAKATLS